MRVASSTPTTAPCSTIHRPEARCHQVSVLSSLRRAKAAAGTSTNHEFRCKRQRRKGSQRLRTPHAPEGAQAQKGKRQPISERTHQPDVQTGNDHQMNRAGGSEQLPLLRTDARALAGHQRQDEPRMPRCAGLKPFLQCPPSTRSLTERLPLADVTRTVDATAEQPAFVVESARVHKTMRPLQPCGEFPTLSHPKRRMILVPAQANPTRHRQAVAIQLEPLDVELEAHAVVPHQRQGGDHTGQPQVPALEFRRQLAPDSLDLG